MYRGNNSDFLFPSVHEERPKFLYQSGESALQLFGNTECNYMGYHGLYSDLDESNRRETLTLTLDPTRLNMSLNILGQDQAVAATDQLGLSTPNPSPNANPNLARVSTGLRLNFDVDEQFSCSATTSSLYGDLTAQIDRHFQEIYQYMRIREEEMLKGLQEIRHKHTLSLLSSMNQHYSHLLRQKEQEFSAITQRNKDLTEKLHQISAEAHQWQLASWQNESLALSLQSQLAKETENRNVLLREECAENDAAESSCVLGDVRKVGPTRQCRCCRRREADALLLGCRHLALCRECEGLVAVCPVCRSNKGSVIPVNLP